MKKTTRLILLLLVMLPNVCVPADSTHSFRVKVSVTAPDNIESQVKSFVSRELRSLGDVIVSDSDFEYVIGILVLVLTTEGGYESGVGISTIVLSTFENEWMIPSIKPESVDLVKNFTSDLYYYPDHQIRVAQRDSIKSQCEQIVAEFDSGYLNPRREAMQRYKDSIKSGIENN